MKNKTREELVQDLRSFAKDEYNLPSLVTLNQYTAAMLRYIGDADMELRDELICSTFYEWIGEKKYYTAGVCKDLASDTIR